MSDNIIVLNLRNFLRKERICSLSDCANNSNEEKDIFIYHHAFPRIIRQGKEENSLEINTSIHQKDLEQIEYDHSYLFFSGHTHLKAKHFFSNWSIHVVFVDLILIQVKEIFHRLSSCSITINIVISLSESKPSEKKSLADC